MNTTIERAREIVHAIDIGTIWVEGDVAGEIAGLLETLSNIVSGRLERLSSLDFALNYYAEPERYLTPVLPGCPILDGGLRARTALDLLTRKYPQQARITHLREFSHE